MSDNIVLFEDEGLAGFGPLAYWRSLGELRVGRKLVLDRMAQTFGLPVAGIWARDWIAPVAAQRCGAPVNRPIEPGTLMINARWDFASAPKIPAGPVVGMVDGAAAFVVCDQKLAAGLSPADLLDEGRRRDALNGIRTVEAPGRMLRHPWDVIGSIEDLVARDWDDTDKGIESDLPSGVEIECIDRVHISPNVAFHRTAAIDASAGPVYISHDVRIGAYAVIEGPAYIGPGSVIKAHAHLHGGVALGPCCKVGGEIDACIFHGYSNKQHAGFLGHSIVGSWVNIGAGTSNSDLKNTYGQVKVSTGTGTIDTGQMLVGAVIADHAKLGINSAIPTGAVIGFAATVATTGFLPKFVPSFAWCMPQEMTGGDPARLLDVATKVMGRRDVDMTDDEIELFFDLGSRAPELEDTDLPRPTRPRNQLVH